MSFSLVFLAGSAAAAPAVTNGPPSVAQGTSATLTGFGFGVKPVPAPQKWDDFESGTPGQRIGGHSAVVGGVWADYSAAGIPPVYSNAVLRPNSGRSSHHQFTNANYNSSLQEIHDNQGTWFWSFWWHMDQDDATRQSKPWVLNGSRSDEPMLYNGFGKVGVDSYLRWNVIDQSGGLVSFGEEDATHQVSGDSTVENVRNKWIRIDVFAKQSGPGVKDGDLRAWYFRGQAVSGPDIYWYPATTRTTTASWRQLMLGDYYGGESTGMNVYMDDVYIDNTQARVELCDASAWSAKTRCEIQVPTAWSGTSITFNANPGAFAGEQTAFLFVVDETGAVNDAGFPVTIGGVPGNVPPSAPTGLGVQ